MLPQDRPRPAIHRLRCIPVQGQHMHTFNCLSRKERLSLNVLNNISQNSCLLTCLYLATPCSIIEHLTHFISYHILLNLKRIFGISMFCRYACDDGQDRPVFHQIGFLMLRPKLLLKHYALIQSQSIGSKP